jgi:hypothetical protein
MLEEADKWARQKADYGKNHGDPNRLPLPDPWQFLLDEPEVGDLGKKIFRAAQSQLVALRRLLHMATGIATLQTDWQQTALKARASGNKRLSDHAADKVAGALIRLESARSMLREFIGNDSTRTASAKAWQARRRAQLVHRSKWYGPDGQRIIKPLPRWREIDREFPIGTWLVFGWVRTRPDGPPGFMFWRNEALTRLVLTLRGREPRSFRNLGRDYVKKLRQNLGLVPVNDAKCLIWDINLSPLTGKGWRVKGHERNGKMVFAEIFPVWGTR